MKLILLIFLTLILIFPSFAQFQVFDQDTVGMTSAAADSVRSNWMEYSDLIGDWREFEGMATLWVATYSYYDGMSDALIIRYQTKGEDDNTGNKRLSKWTTLDSVIAADVSTNRYGSGDQDGIQFNLADKADPWSPTTAIRFEFYWAPGALDTCEIHPILNLVESN